MGTLLDTTVFVDIERAVRARPPANAMLHVRTSLETNLGPAEEVGIAAITAAELLHGVHRASPHHHSRRAAFVEAILAAFPPIPFDLLEARAHAELWADLARTGRDIGPHDRIVAATAIATGWRIGTANIKHFDHIPGLELVPVTIPVR